MTFTDEELTALEIQFVGGPVPRLIAALRATRAALADTQRSLCDALEERDHARLDAEQAKADIYAPGQVFCYEQTPAGFLACDRMAKHKGQHSWVLDVFHERSCYECGHHVCDGEGEQHGRSGWVHTACMSGNE